MELTSKKLLDRVRDAIRLKHYSIRTEQAYASCIKRCILFHGKRHPRKMAEAETEAFLTHLSVECMMLCRDPCASAVGLKPRSAAACVAVPAWSAHSWR